MSLLINSFSLFEFKISELTVKTVKIKMSELTPKIPKMALLFFIESEKSE